MALIAMWNRETEIVEVVVENLPGKKAPHADGFTGKLYQKLKKEYQINSTEKRRANFQTQFITLIPKQDRQYKKNTKQYPSLNINAKSPTKY